MKWRIDAVIILDREDDARRIFRLLKRFKPLMVTIKGGEVGEERSYVRLHKCRHDETPPKPCEVVEEFGSE